MERPKEKLFLSIILKNQEYSYNIVQEIHKFDKIMGGN
jgi:hypothetical protein